MNALEENIKDGVFCKCGCGLIVKKKASGVQPNYITFHKPSDYLHNNILVFCACGCGKQRKKFCKNGIEREYISGHNDAHSANRKYLICAFCKQRSKQKTKKQKFCSYLCWREYIKLPREFQKRRITKPCFNCKTPVTRKKSQFNGRRAFCSPKCRYSWQRQFFKELYKDKISRYVKLVKSRDKSQCKICAFNIIVEVHHIVPRRKGGSDELSNLITLCPNHHTMADRGIISAESLFALIE